MNWILALPEIVLSVSGLAILTACVLQKRDSSTMATMLVLAAFAVTAAFASTLAELRDPDQIVCLIEERAGIVFPGASVITSAASELASILAWGCPTLLT